jgi:hypothetical protein
VILGADEGFRDLERFFAPLPEFDCADPVPPGDLSGMFVLQHCLRGPVAEVEVRVFTDTVTQTWFALESPAGESAAILSGSAGDSVGQDLSGLVVVESLEAVLTEDVPSLEPSLLTSRGRRGLLIVLASLAGGLFLYGNPPPVRPGIQPLLELLLRLGDVSEAQGVPVGRHAGRRPG